VRCNPLLGATLIGLALSGCSSGDVDDLYVFVQQAKARQTAKIEPLPPIKAFETFAYAAQSARDPFVPPAQPEPEEEVAANKGNGLSPDFARAREELERFTLDSLRMVGTLAQNEATYGIVLAPGGSVYRVRPENFLGKNHGRITAITNDKIKLTEIVPDGADGWVKRQAALALSE
jgi:type IV pilus assembly protein PilP